MKYFVLGGKGFIGSAFVRQLEALGYEVHAIDKSTYAEYVGEACDVLINANGNSSKVFCERDPIAAFEENVNSTFRSLRDFRTKYYVFLSTSDVYPDTSSEARTLESQVLSVQGQSVYGLQKHLAELCVMQGTPSWLIVRQGGFVGPGLRKNAVFDVLHGQRTWVSPLSTFQYLNVDTSAGLVLELISSMRNAIVNLTGRGSLSLYEIANVLGKSPAFDQALPVVNNRISVQLAQRYVEIPTTLHELRNFAQMVHRNASA